MASGTNKTSEIRYMKTQMHKEKIKTRFYDKYTVRKLIWWLSMATFIQLQRFASKILKKNLYQLINQKKICKKYNKLYNIDN